MKIFISADIEGVTGITVWDEIRKEHPDYQEFRDQMTKEVCAACEGALSAGATEIWINDAHATGRNIMFDQLPRKTKLIRGWSGHPFSMMDQIDESFQAAMMIGYHSPASSDKSPLAHTKSGAAEYVRINGKVMSEFSLNTFTASLVKVPVTFIAGDRGICEEAGSLVPGITTCVTKDGIGHCTISDHPAENIEKIREGVTASLSGQLNECLCPLPDRFQVEIKYREHTNAYKASFYPGCRRKDNLSIEFESDNHFDVLRLIAFVI